MTEITTSLLAEWQAEACLLGQEAASNAASWVTTKTLL
jgi:hypothetical protein